MKLRRGMTGQQYKEHWAGWEAIRTKEIPKVFRVTFQSSEENMVFKAPVQAQAGREPVSSSSRVGVR